VGSARRTWLAELYRQHNTQFEIRNGDINAGAPGGSNGFGVISGARDPRIGQGAVKIRF
jgi:hypothetical protein